VFDLTDVLSRTKLEREDIPAQVTVAERKVLKYLASRLTGAGAIVDLGAGAGSSTRAMAEGAASNPAVASRSPALVAYDWFEFGPGRYASRSFKSSHSPVGDPSYLEDFRYFMGEYAKLVDDVAGDIKTVQWDRGPIELLHVDICKERSIFNHIARTFLPHLVPGRSILVHQDFSRPRLPWIHYSVGAMASVIEPFARVGGSVYYRVLDRPPAELIEHVADMKVDEMREMARIGIENASDVPAFNSSHFASLAELTDIYIDFWFIERAQARRRLREHSKLPDFQRHYPELVAEIENVATVRATPKSGLKGH
jgi:hypothetical protein